MTSPDTSAVAPVPDPPGDFGVASVWTSPSTYMALATFFLPLATTIFHKDVSGEAQAFSNAAAGIAVVALIIARASHKNTVLTANKELALERLRQPAQVPVPTEHLARMVKDIAQTSARIAVHSDEAHKRIDALETAQPVKPARKRAPKGEHPNGGNIIY